MQREAHVRAPVVHAVDVPLVREEGDRVTFERDDRAPLALDIREARRPDELLGHDSPSSGRLPR